ncbi:hypothetical protein COOONC_19749 [Cooperia oncophora]
MPAMPTRICRASSANARTVATCWWVCPVKVYGRTNGKEPRLYRASGRFQKRVVAAVPTHDVTTVPPRPASLDSSAVSQFNYDEDVHNLNKLTEDNSILEEAAEFAKGLERTTVAVRGDEELRTTTAPANNFANAPAIITPTPHKADVTTWKRSDFGLNYRIILQQSPRAK